MKKLFFALALMTFVVSVASTAYAASNGVSTEIKKDDKKKKKKKGACCSAEKGATTTKACCTKKP